jgi:hypothetical protein
VIHCRQNSVVCHCFWVASSHVRGGASDVQESAMNASSPSVIWLRMTTVESSMPNRRSVVRRSTSSPSSLLTVLASPYPGLTNSHRARRRP